MRPAAQRALAALVAVLLLRVLFGLAFGLALPPWESYDEPPHFAYALQIARFGRLPSDDDPDPSPERIQPPLYYLVLAGALRLSGSALEGYRPPEQNPYFAYGTAGLNYALHPLRIAPADRAIEVSLLFTRFVTLLITLPGVAFAYRAARAVWRGGGWGRRSGLPIMVAAIVALWPQAIFNSSVVSNDGPALLFGALVTWLILALRPREGQRWALLRLIAALGAVLIGMLVKLNLILLAVPVVLAALLTVSPLLIVSVLGLGAASLTGALLLLQTNPAILIPLFRQDGSGNSFFSTMLNRLADPGLGTFLGQSVEYGLNSSFGLFGWGNIPLPGAVQAVYVAVIGVGALGLLALVVRAALRRADRGLFGRPAQWLLLMAVVGAVLAGALVLAVFYMSIHLVPGRYLLPALPAFAILLLLGWRALRLRRVLWAALPLLVSIDLIIPVAVIGPPFEIPPAVAEVDIPNRIPGADPNVAAGAELAPGIFLLGWALPAPEVYVGEDFTLDLYVRAVARPTDRIVYKVEVVGPDGEGYALLETIPGAGTYLSTDWTPGRLFRDRVMVRIRQDYPTPGIGYFRVSLMSQPPIIPYSGGIVQLPAPAGALSQPPRYAQFGRVVVHNRAVPGLLIPSAQAALFRDGLLLRGMSLSLPDRRTLRLDLTWEVRARLPDGTLFVHVRCGDACPTPGSLLAAQKDSPPRGGLSPTSIWLPGEFVTDPVLVALPDALPEGTYPIQIGWYDSTGAAPVRWPIRYAAAIRAADDILGVGTLSVAADGSRSVQTTYPGTPPP